MRLGGLESVDRISEIIDSIGFTNGLRVCPWTNDRGKRGLKHKEKR